MKTIVMLIILILQLIPTYGWTQMSFTDPSNNSASIGAFYSQHDFPLCGEENSGVECLSLKTRQITGSFDFHIMEDTRLSLYPSITLANMNIGNENLSVPTSPGVYVRLSSHSANIGGSNLGVFYLGEAGASYIRMTANYSYTIHSIITSYGGGIGIYRKFKDFFPEFVLTPSFGIYYHNLSYYVNLGPDFNDAYMTSAISGQIEIEVEISPNISIIGISTFSFQNSKSIFALGLNFH